MLAFRLLVKATARGAGGGPLGAGGVKIVGFHQNLLLGIYCGSHKFGSG
jgi:hypothetical protein